LAGDSYWESYHSGDEIDYEDVKIEETPKEIDYKTCEFFFYFRFSNFLKVWVA
jgi:hypothetical protein